LILRIEYNYSEIPTKSKKNRKSTGSESSKSTRSSIASKESDDEADIIDKRKITKTKKAKSNVIPTRSSNRLKETSDTKSKYLEESISDDSD
jgi:hypothetical protein